MRRSGVEIEIKKLVVGETPRDPAVYYLYFVGITYLVIGLFVYFRRSTAYKAQHFYIFCLVSFIFCTFHYTGKLNNFDKLMYWGNVTAGLLAPVIFAHFCLVFPEPRKWFRRRVVVAGTVRAGGCDDCAVLIGEFRHAADVSIPLIELRWMLDRMWLGLLTGIYLLGGLALTLEFRQSRRSRGATPTAMAAQRDVCRHPAFRAVLYAAVSSWIHSLAADEGVGTFAATDPAEPGVRDRALPADGRGYPVPARIRVYAGDGVCAGRLLRHHHSRSARWCRRISRISGNTPAVVVMLAAAFLFQPLRNWIQEGLDRYFYRDKYDYRLHAGAVCARIERRDGSGRDAALGSGPVARKTLSISHSAFFLSDDGRRSRAAAVPPAHGSRAA